MAVLADGGGGRQGVTKRRRQSWLTNRAQMRGGGGSCGVLSANEYSCIHGAKINLGDLNPYLTYGGWAGSASR
jgi:hypothetical protein